MFELPPASAVIALSRLSYKLETKSSFVRALSPSLVLSRHTHPHDTHTHSGAISLKKRAASICINYIFIFKSVCLNCIISILNLLIYFFLGGNQI